MEKKVRGNPDKLIPNSKRTPQELREMTQNAGIKSGEVRRWKAAIQRVIQDNDRDKMIEQLLATYKKSGGYGKVQILQYLRDTEGEKPTERLEADINRDNAPPEITLRIVKGDKDA